MNNDDTNFSEAFGAAVTQAETEGFDEKDNKLASGLFDEIKNLKGEADQMAFAIEVVKMLKTTLIHTANMTREMVMAEMMSEVASLINELDLPDDDADHPVMH